MLTHLLYVVFSTHRSTTGATGKRSAYPAIRVNRANRQDAHEVAAGGV
nr:MAG TPA_asm: hypothetical protein [Caudoviricetes sp.]